MTSTTTLASRFAAAGLMACALSLYADTAIWTNNTAAIDYWTNTTYWVDENGDNLALPPTNHTHDVMFGPLAHDKTQLLRWNGWTSYDKNTNPTGQMRGNQYVDFGMLSISDSSWASRRRIHIQNQTATSGLSEWGVNITIDDPDGFGGFWVSDYGRVGFILPATAEKSPHLSNVSIDKRVPFTVPTAGTKAVVESVYSRGAIEKKGAGELHVMATSGSDTIAHVTEGTLTLEGSLPPETGDDLPVPGALLHLDASRTDTMQWYTGDDGRTYVTNWNDVRGNGQHAWFDTSYEKKVSHQSEYSHPPFLNATIVANRNVMDFGRSTTSQSADLGPVGCWMLLCKDVNVAPYNNIREVFYTGHYLPTATSTTLIGNYADGMAYIHFHRTGNANLVNTYAACEPIRFGDILFDGCPGYNARGSTRDYEYKHDAFTVVAIGATNAIHVSALATDRMYEGRVGGCRIGEVVLYTNSLTHAERLKVSNYLMRKWKNDNGVLENVDADIVTLASDNVALGVPEGRRAKVQEVMAKGGTLVKSGAGTLSVGAVSTLRNENPPVVDVRAGDVEFESLSTDVDAPAANPYFWLDATVESSFVFTNGADSAKEYLAEWHDKRSDQTAVYAKIPTPKASDYVEGAWPTLVRNAVGDKTVVDFGERGLKTPTSSFMVLNTGTSANAYDAFVVLRFTSAAGAGHDNVFGSSSINLYRSTQNARLLEGAGYGLYPTWAATWTINGAPADPIRNGDASFGTSEFYVVSMSAATKQNVDYIGGKDRMGQGTTYGGQQVAEQIIYDRRLSPAERRQTIAYLMKRWRGDDAPGVGPTRIAAMKFADEIPAVVNSVCELEVDKISGGNGTLVKRGSGVASLSLRDMNEMSDISVETGTLDVDFRFDDTSVVHIDASRDDLLTFYVTENGARTNVTSVADVRENGIVANAWINHPATNANTGLNCAVSYTNPVWRAIVREDGIARPAFDFGRKSGYYTTKHEDSSSAFRLSKRFTNIREAHAVFSDNDNNDRGHFFCDSSDYHYMRGGRALFDKTYASPLVTNGYIAVDGNLVTGPYSYYPAGFHVISCAPTGNTSVGAIAGERNIEAGGCYVSEMICFTNYLPELKRKYLQDMLMHKWMGRAKPAWPDVYASITVAAGATLNITGDPILSVAKIGGGGTVTGGSFTNVSEIEVRCAGGATEPFTYSGGISFAQSVTVTLAGEPGTLASGGTYPLVNASSLDGLENVTWTVQGLPARKRRKVSVSGGTLSLTLVPAGTAIGLR